MEHFESADQLMKERSDDEKELLRTRKRETLSQKISRFLGGEMSADESDSFSRDHSSEIDQEIRRRESEADRKKAQDSENAKIFWAGGGTRDETYQAHVELERFLRSHSELQAETPENVRNGRMLHDWLATEKLSCTVANLERGYDHLRATGALILKSAEEQRVEKLSADQYRRERPELADNRVPPMLIRQTETALLTFISTHPQYVPCEGNRALMMQWLSEVGLPCTSGNLDSAFTALQSQGLLKLNDAVVTSGATTLTDYGDTRQHGVPPQPSKYSFRQKINSMSASEIAERCAHDPAFREALDNLER